MSIAPTFKARCRRCGRTVTSAVPVDLCPVCSLGALMAGMRMGPDDSTDEPYDLDTSEPTNKPATLNELAAECHELAVARGKYSRWNTLIGRNAIQSELTEWYAEASFAEDHPNDTAYHEEEYGDLLHAVLSVGHQMGYDIDAALAGAMERNRKRAKGGA